MTTNTMTFNLYGELGEKFGKTFVLECSTVRQGLDILFANFKAMKAYIVESDKWLAGYEVWSNNTQLAPRDEDFTMERQGVEVKIIPVTKGASANARIIVGAILVFIGYLGVTVLQAWGGGAWGPVLIKIGAAMIASGVAEKLAAKPMHNNASERNATDKATSYIFSGPVNNTKQGAAIPIGYGRMIVGSNVINSSFTVVDIPVREQ